MWSVKVREIQPALDTWGSFGDGTTNHCLHFVLLERSRCCLFCWGPGYHSHPAKLWGSVSQRRRNPQKDSISWGQSLLSENTVQLKARGSKSRASIKLYLTKAEKWLPLQPRKFHSGVFFFKPDHHQTSLKVLGKMSHSPAVRCSESSCLLSQWRFSLLWWSLLCQACVDVFTCSLRLDGNLREV